ncbi:MAG TPA: IPTL-CTERM sorting domain-containing protein [Casimicrobiaceae bacterium]|nr:IPTL-CTERM sorting domain-containing protein [Casimicrobiaceae bacterium]
MRVNSVYRHIIGLGAVALILAVGTARAQSFIYGDSAGNGLYKIDTSTGAVVAECSQSKGNGRGMVVVGSVVYYTVTNSGNVYKTNFTTCSDDGIAFAVPGATSLSTIAYDGTNFWIGDYAGSNHAFYVSPTGTLLNTISLANCAGSCDGLEFFSGKLISNRGDAATGGYDVYSTTGTLLTADFIAPTSYAGTGIAFDGTNFYVSDIFNQKLQVYSGTTGAFIKTITITGMTLSNEIEDLSADYSVTLGPPTAAATVPTMTEWGVLLMSMLVAVSGIFALRRRRH